MNQNKEKTIELFILRHGETLWNKEIRIQGHRDSPLTEEGAEQALQAGIYLKKKYEIDRGYCSDLGRAVQTAEIIGAVLPVEFSRAEDLRERKLGIFEGLTVSEVKQKFPDEFCQYSNFEKGHTYIVPEGESNYDVLARVLKFFDNLYSQSAHDEKILIVTHGGVLNVLFKNICGIPPGFERNYSLFNCSINRIQISKEGYKILTWGELPLSAGMDANKTFA